MPAVDISVDVPRCLRRRSCRRNPVTAVGAVRPRRPLQRICLWAGQKRRQSQKRENSDAHDPSDYQTLTLKTAATSEI